MELDSRNANLNRPLEYRIWTECDKVFYQTWFNKNVKDYFWSRKSTNGIEVEAFPDDISVKINNNHSLIVLRNEGMRFREGNVNTNFEKLKSQFLQIRRAWPDIVGHESSNPIHTTKSNVSTQPTQGETTMFDTAKNLIADNKDIAIVEAERKIGLTAFEKLEDVISQKFPGSEGFLKSPLGAIALANGVRAIGTLYTGPKKELVDGTTKVLLRGAYAKCGDSIDLNGFIETLFESVKSVVPGNQNEVK